MQRKTVTAIAVLVVMMVVGRPAQGQDAHYWSLQYGTRAELLGGAVIGSKVGLSNTYYNPGALALLERPSLVLSSLALELVTYDLPQENGNDLGSTVLSTVPNFVAGSLWFRLGGSQLAYSFLTRQQFDVRMTLRAQIRTPGTGGAPDTSASGEVLTEVKANENWVGLTWSRAVGRGLGVGLTQYFAYRSQRTRGQATGQVVGTDGSGIAALYVDEFDYWQLRTLTKLGALYESQPWSVGVTVTTPSLGLFGDGTVYTSYFDPIAPGTAQSAASYDQGLEPDFRSSWAVGAGMSYRFGDTRVHASVEWFQGIGPHEVLSTPPLPVAPSGVAVSSAVIEDFDSVTNYGLGVEYRLASHVELYLSGITNFSARPELEQGTTAVSTWDIYQFTAGSNFAFGGMEFTVGVEYGFGNDNTGRLGFSRLSDSDEGAIVIEPGQQEVRYRRLEAFLGFTFLFGDDPADKPRATLGDDEDS